ncbi:hypothetical protein [Flavobacterium sp. N1736]|uniref:hypothetical protein n=1 Tax=Flavobacterium sp. N1736 TaxID=2986823 RepID=UPI0022259BFB|nr:hypothetical protein [Flavobacterium sp. N1736]
MRNFIWSFLVSFCIIFSSFSQTKTIEKGTYISTNKGQKIKLNLLEDNKYELVFYTGEYKIKGDSLLFFQKAKAESAFNVVFNKGKKSDKVKIKFIDPSYYAFYIGTQNGSEPVQYQKITDIRTKTDPDWKDLDVEFEIDRADYVYFVYEGYETESQLSKFALPKDVSEVTVKYELDVLGDLNIAGFLDKKTNELRVSEQGGKNPLVFVNEKDAQPENTTSKVTPLENEKISKWTYPGKEPLVADDFGTTDVTVDTTAIAYPVSTFDFKFKIENNLKSALATTKTAKNKFLVVSVDNKNPNAKADFNAFLKDTEAQVGYSMYNGYDAQFDVFNYYPATADDKKWLKTNKIADDPSVVVLNSDGDILATAKASLLDKKSELSYYDSFYKSLQITDAFYAFNKVQKNKKASDADLVSAFYKAAATELPYDYHYEEDSTYANDVTYFKYTKVGLNKKEVSQIWKKLIEAHQKDTKPNRYLVETILKEIKNQGFYKHFFNEDRILNDTDFLAIDYLLKHYDAIQIMNTENEQGEAIAMYMGSLSTEISSSLQQNTYISQEGIEGSANQDKIISVYKKLIASGKGDYDCYKNYFTFLTTESEKSNDDTALIKEFNAYFEKFLSTEKGNAIQRLDEMYATINPEFEYNYGGWNAFKEYHSNLANSVAWQVTLKPENASYIKAAINWSEYSLVITKNNPYYLDTLGQLYYKDGQKEKAIATQTLAVKFLDKNIEEQTAMEIRETLTKMQNGTY